jgi:hypothetical protein
LPYEGHTGLSSELVNGIVREESSFQGSTAVFKRKVKFVKNTNSFQGPIKFSQGGNWDCELRK